MNRPQISDRDVRDPNLLRSQLQRAMNHNYDLLERVTSLENSIRSASSRASGQGREGIVTLGGGGLTDAERTLLQSLMLGSTDNPISSQTSVVPSAGVLPPVQSAVNGQLVYLTTDQKIYRFSSTPSPGTWIALGVSGGTLTVGTYAARPAASTKAAGDVYWATDRGVAWINISSVWNYLFGTHRALLASKPTLTADDAGYLFYATDYFHLHRWTGSAWTFAPGDDGSAYIGWYIEAPNQGYWQLCNGSTAAVDQPTATTSNVVTPNLAVYSSTFTDQFAGSQTIVGAYILGSDTYTGTIDGPYFVVEQAAAYVAGAAVTAMTDQPFPTWLALLPYLRR